MVKKLILGAQVQIVFVLILLFSVFCLLNFKAQQTLLSFILCFQNLNNPHELLQIWGIGKRS